MFVKICGITRREDALAAIEHGAGALGFNFWPGSPRCITPERAEFLLKGLPPQVWKVGVFVNESPDLVEALTHRLRLDVVQLHGNAPQPAVARVWKAVPVDEAFSFEKLLALDVEAFLLDAPAGERHGGTGRSFDWSRVAGAPVKVVLAGGLDAGNVRQAIQTARPWGVDACSRIESAPGIKDHRKMAEFLRAAREAF